MLFVTPVSTVGSTYQPFSRCRDARRRQERSRPPAGPGPACPPTRLRCARRPRARAGFWRRGSPFTSASRSPGLGPRTPSRVLGNQHPGKGVTDWPALPSCSSRPRSQPGRDPRPAGSTRRTFRRFEGYLCQPSRDRWQRSASRGSAAGDVTRGPPGWETTISPTSPAPAPTFSAPGGKPHSLKRAASGERFEGASGAA